MRAKVFWLILLVSLTALAMWTAVSTPVQTVLLQWNDWVLRESLATVALTSAASGGLGAAALSRLFSRQATLQESVYRSQRQKEKADVQREQLADRVKALEAKNDALERALQQALGKGPGGKGSKKDSL